ncbi:zinc metalloprotease [Geomesophilobacter sediminis]|uniref:Uncharacterized protein n=1 Tax=Geomesophilobacter sediminis TaxID=2798584 RepID=A0A8J7LUF9_9BACT|nr:hypothetical protein [Geomesophilobacter sediminis]MBJ6724604.1 hypothetical protein [Geomesophilobacter sediminis]
MIRLKEVFLLGVLVLGIGGQPAFGLEKPLFLPSFYLSAVENSLPGSSLVQHSTRDGVELYLYSKDNASFVGVQNIKVDAPKLRAVMSYLFQNFTKEIGSNGGEYIVLNNNEMYAKIDNNEMRRTVFVFAVPTAVHIWTYTGVAFERVDLDEKFRILKELANRERYLEAKSAGNVAMGSWGTEIYDYYLELVKENKKKEAWPILQELLATSPYNYRAHADVVRESADVKAAENSARIILKNAEDQSIRALAMRFLGQQPLGMESIPYLPKRETGLEVVLVPLGPCDVTLLKDVAKVYEKITEIPVKVRRLKENWKWRTPDRIPYQRSVQESIVKMTEEKIDFQGWTKDKYITGLTKAAESKDPLTRYQVKSVVEKIKTEDGSYLVDPYLEEFSRILARYRSNDSRVMYVGITANNIFSGDSNFVFSLYSSGQQSPASLMSYYMMLSKNLSEDHESRMRLVERIAKELVPASLKALGIPRSTDPTCPYSYSNGTSRLDEKTLVLSDPVKEAINKIKARK